MYNDFPNERDLRHVEDWHDIHYHEYLLQVCYGQQKQLRRPVGVVQLLDEIACVALFSKHEFSTYKVILRLW